ncbi:MAG: biopolymer transport protein TolA [Rhodocyclaceae bacterium]|nr:biopolymer transport protein TolA [Rhodocyclaceae bacterium]
MENRPLSLAARLIFVAGYLAASAVAWAQSDGARPAPDQRADWDRRLEEARGLQEKGTALEQQAKEAYEARKKACFKKFRVAGCQQEARDEYVEAANEARRIENDGKARERQVKKEELADEDARRLAREPQRQADLQAREAEIRAEQEHSESTRAAKLAEKEEQARIGAERRAADEERLRKKQEAHQRKVAEKMAKARQREKAEAGR